MPKNIMICFDGTGNHPKDAKQERAWFGHGEIEDNGITNVLKLHCMFGGNLRNEPSNVASVKATGQRSFYYSGVGTYGNKVQQLFNAGFASSNLDVRTIMYHAGEDLYETYKKGDKIFLTGFSRGAAIARKFASKLDRYLKDKANLDQKPIRFVGLFDTVASIGFPNLSDEDKPQSDVVFEDNRISPKIQEALHLLSLDDKRIAFQPTLMHAEKRVTEIWFAGAHSDVGGGFWHDGLADIPLDFMISEIARRKLGVAVLKPEESDFENLEAPDGSYAIDEADVDLKPNPEGESHQQDRWGPMGSLTLNARAVRVKGEDGDSNLPLPLVHETVKERMNKVVKYRPKALKGVSHRVMKKNGTVVKKKEDGLKRYI